MAIDVRGIGETATTPWRYLNSLEWTGPAVAEFFISYMLGKSFLGMRAEDILVAAQYLSTLTEGDSPQPVRVYGFGELGPPALHASALEPGLISSLVMHRSLDEWASVVKYPVARNALVNVVHGALKVYDFPELVSLIGAENITIVEPVDAQGRMIE